MAMNEQQPASRLSNRSSERLVPVTGPACWTGAELRQRDDWVHTLDSDEISELECALERLTTKQLTTIQSTDFELPRLGPRLARIRTEILNGTGLVLMRGLPVTTHDEQTVAKMLWCIGLHLGIPQPQDASGALLHHVRDTGVNVAGRDDVRTYETKEAQPWHNDGGDVFLLLCKETALNGGRSYVASAYKVFNLLLQRAPDLVRTLQDDFHFDARGQQLAGRGRVQTVPIFNWHRERLYLLHKRHYIEHAQRFDEVPPLSAAQRDALDAFDEVCSDPSVHLAFDLEPGDMEIGHNFNVLHRRGSFDTSTADTSRRHMMRLWLGLPDGWPLPEAFRHTREFGPLFNVREQAN